MPAPVEDYHYQFGLTLIAVTIGFLASLLMDIYLRRYPRNPAPVLPWYYWMIQSVGLVGFASLFGFNWFSLIFFAAALALAARMVWAFYKQRPQFALRSLLVATFVVAVFCSASRYVPIVPVILLISIPALQWIRLQAEKMPAGTEQKQSEPEPPTRTDP